MGTFIGYNWKEVFFFKNGIIDYSSMFHNQLFTFKRIPTVPVSHRSLLWMQCKKTVTQSVMHCSCLKNNETKCFLLEKTNGRVAILEVSFTIPECGLPEEQISHLNLVFLLCRFGRCWRQYSLSLSQHKVSPRGAIKRDFREKLGGGRGV